MKFASIPGGSALMLDPRVARLQKLRKTVYNAGMGIEDEVASLPVRHVCWFITLTYRGVGDWRPQHVRDYLKRVRVWLYRRHIPMRYVWVAELQRRGAVHYHLLLWLPRGVKLPYSDTRGWWPHGFTEQKPARKRVGYLMKYTSKGSKDADHDFPRGCRLYGYGGVCSTTRRRVRWWRAPARVRLYFGDVLGLTFDLVDLRKIVGGWLDKLSGLMLESNWKLYCFSKSKLVFFQIHDPDVFNVKFLHDFALQPAA